MIPPNFYKIIKDFMVDLLGTFPELKTNHDIMTICSNEQDAAMASYEAVFQTIITVFPTYSIHILQEQEDMFKTDCVLLPNVNFKVLWNDQITVATKNVIWKYLKLIMFVVMGHMNTGDLFQDESMRDKMKEAMEDIQTFFDNKNEGDPASTDFHAKLESMMGGTIGNLAKEIAADTLGEHPEEETLKTMMNNPAKMFDLMNSVGEKINTKIKSGQIKESDLIQEATDMLQHMKDMPGMKQFDAMFKQFGNNVNMNATKTNMEQKLKKVKTKERLQAKLEKRKNKNKP